MLQGYYSHSIIIHLYALGKTMMKINSIYVVENGIYYKLTVKKFSPDRKKPRCNFFLLKITCRNYK